MAKAPWDVKATEAIGKALPNEFSKLSPWLRYVPYIGQLLTVLGAADTGATTYSDIYTQAPEGTSPMERRKSAVMPAIQSTIGTVMGSSSNPGAFGSSGNKLKRNWADYVGLAGNLWGGYKGGNYGSMASSGLNIYDAVRGEGASTRGYDVWNPGNNTANPEWENAVYALANAMSQYQSQSKKG